VSAQRSRTKNEAERRFYKRVKAERGKGKGRGCEEGSDLKRNRDIEEGKGSTELNERTKRKSGYGWEGGGARIAAPLLMIF